jgi:MoxR-like ATPase
MSSLLLTSPRPVYASALASALGVGSASLGPEGPTRLRVGPSASPSAAGELVARLAPLHVPCEVDPALGDAMALDVGDRVRVTSPVRVAVPLAWRTSSMEARLPIVLVDGSGAPGAGPACVFVEPGGRGAHTSVVAQLLVAVLGLPGWTGVKDMQGVKLVGSATGCSALLPALRLNLRGHQPGDPTHRRLMNDLRKDGWVVERASPARGRVRRAAVRVPADLPASSRQALLACLATHLPEIAPSSLEEHGETAVEIYLPPVKAEERPATLQRVVVRTDDVEAAAGFVEAMRVVGEAVDITLSVGVSFEGGFRVRHHPHLTGASELRDLIRCAEQAHASVDPAGKHVVNVYRGDMPSLKETVEVDLPLRAARDGALLAELLAGMGAFHVHVGGADRPRELIRRLEDGLRPRVPAPRVSELGVSRGDPGIAIGSASMEVGRHVASVVEELTGVRLDVRRNFAPTDDDIWVMLPAGTRLRDTPRPQAAQHVKRHARIPFLEFDARHLRIGDRTLLRREGHPLAPSLALFEHTCLDTPTCALLDHLVTGVRLREPVLLEGPTAAGKTSTVLLLAALLGQPVVRLNLSGQTDTGELIGRYAPREEGWAWQEGVIPKAMREGWWVILDEINLAEPAVAERLNPALERQPSLVLTEGDGTRFGPGGVPVADGFMVFATMNPSDGAYGGRNALSPALRDRFTAQRACPSPGEPEHAALLAHSVFGRAPSVIVRGVAWEGTRVSQGHAPHASIAGLMGMHELLHRLARFHASVDAACRAEDEAQRLGATRREGLTVSRRTPLALLDFVALRMEDRGARLDDVMEEAVHRYYVARSASAEDAAAIDGLAHASGVFGGGQLRVEEVA